jgi:hypothetical protein
MRISPTIQNNSAYISCFVLKGQHCQYQLLIFKGTVMIKGTVVAMDAHLTIVMTLNNPYLETIELPCQPITSLEKDGHFTHQLGYPLAIPQKKSSTFYKIQ